jgi:hypothetical protein
MNLGTLAAALALSLAAPAAIAQNALDQRFDARSQPRQAPFWWCDTWGTYYPYVLTCPVPWRAVNPSPAARRPFPAASAGASERPAAPAETTPARAAPSSSFPTLGDGLDDWCADVKLPSSIAICSDAELRSLMIERGRAFDEAKSRLPLDQQKALLVDQKGWVASYPQACGVARDVAPLPLAPAIKDCMARAGRARIAYLRGYDLPAAGNLTPEAPTARPAAPNEAQFAQGLRDRRAWEDWFNGLSGDEQAGASFWAAERSRPNPGDCLGTAVFIQGCQEAKAGLAGADRLRKAEPEYRTGWNSYIRPAAPPGTAAPPPPAGQTGGSPPATPPNKAAVWSPASPWLPALTRTAENKNPPAAAALPSSSASAEPNIPALNTDNRQCVQSAQIKLDQNIHMHPDQYAFWQQQFNLDQQFCARQRARGQWQKQWQAMLNERWRAGVRGTLRTVPPIPGILVCQHFYQTKSMYDLYVEHNEETMRDRISHGQYSEMNGPPGPLPSPEDYGCVLVPDNTSVVMTKSEYEFIPTVTGKLASGETFTGKTLPGTAFPNEDDLPTLDRWVKRNNLLPADQRQ